MLKVMTIVGTRPELIRLSRVIARLDETVDHVLVHTGQNYDYMLNEVFFAELGIRKPDHQLGVDTSSLGRVLGETLIRSEVVLTLEKPDAVLILGDTNSSIAALMAKRMHIPVYHMEAGNRCFDENVPEETNRRMVDHVADFNLVYTEHARRNLLAEGIQSRRILHTGSPMREVLGFYHEQIADSTIRSALGHNRGEYFLVSAHREENVDHRLRLIQLFECLRAVRRSWGLPILLSTHPRTRKRVQTMGGEDVEGVVFHEPFGFFDYVRLQEDAACVISDSGTVAEEAAILGFPAVTIRDSIERPEALDTGNIIMTGLDSDDLTDAISVVMRGHQEISSGGVIPPDDYLPSNTSDRVVRYILSTARRHKSWSGIRE